jgi:hypothetical protein
MDNLLFKAQLLLSILKEMKSNTDLGLRYVVAQSPAISLFATGLTKGEKQFDPTK